MVRPRAAIEALANRLESRAGRVHTLTTPLVLIVAVVAVATYGLSRRMEAGHLTATVIFTLYLVGGANFVILPLTYDPKLAGEVGPIPIERLIELTPFFFPGGDSLSSEQLFLNVVLTVPFGFGLPFVIRLPGRSVLLVGLLVSLGIELAQLAADALYLALPPWSIDINDVFLNSLGVAVGYGAFRVLSAVYAKSVGRVSVRGTPWRHFHETLAEAGKRR